MSRFVSIGLHRHRIGRDGDGVTTLVGGFGCPLDCRYCLNPQCKTMKKPCEYTVEELYEKLRIDSLYFDATAGGVTFGGGEPLLQSDFISDFIGYVKAQGNGWRFFVESSLAVSDISPLLPLIDGWIVDIKDMDPDIYRAYTGSSSELMLENLERLRKVADRVRVRIPLIESFNTAKDNELSEKRLRTMGFQSFDRFSYEIYTD